MRVSVGPRGPSGARCPRETVVRATSSPAESSGWRLRAACSPGLVLEKPEAGT